MGTQTCFIRPEGGEWLQLHECTIAVVINRRMTRTVTHGGEGDDLIDEGSESAEYTVTGEIDLDDSKKVLEIFRGGQPFFHEPYEEKEMKVVFSKLTFDGGSGQYSFHLIEDIR